MMKDKLKFISKKVGIILVLYVVLMAVFIGAMTRSYSLNNKRIVNHVYESAQTIEKEGVYPRVILNAEKAQLDNFTDSWMLTIAMGIDGKTSIDSAMSCYYKFNEDSEDKAENLLRVVRGEKTEEYEYTRYWHGYQVFLRPLLQVFNYEEIRYINIFGIMGLL